MGTSVRSPSARRRRLARYGMIVAAVRGICITAPAIESAVRSCSRRCRSRDEAASRQDHHAEDVGVAHDVGHQFQGRAVETTVLALDDLEADRLRGGVGRAPALLERARHDGVDVEVHRAHRVGVEGVAVLQGALGGQVVVVDEDHHPVGADIHGRRRGRGLEGVRPRAGTAC